MITIVGGDGSGKSTAVDGLYEWLAPEFDTTRVHMGKPRWSLLTVAVRVCSKWAGRWGCIRFCGHPRCSPWTRPL